VRLQRRRGALQCAAGVGRERAKRRDPQKRERRRVVLRAFRCERHRGRGDRKRLAHAGRRVQKAALAGGDRRPHVALERERREPERRVSLVDAARRQGVPDASFASSTSGSTGFTR
jgi:hypothetical protein